MSLLAIRHLAYDFVFAAPVAALAFRLPRLSQVCVMASLAYLWFGLKLLTSMDITGKWVEVLSSLTLCFVLVIVLSAQRRTPDPPAVSAGGMDG